jgi:hypothetical protein
MCLSTSCVAFKIVFTRNILVISAFCYNFMEEFFDVQCFPCLNIKAMLHYPQDWLAPSIDVNRAIYTGVRDNNLLAFD